MLVRNYYYLLQKKRRSKFFKEIQLESFFESEIENFDNSDISNQKELIHHYINNESLSFSATSLSLYDSCPLAYKYKMLDRLKVEGYSPEAAFGIFVHNIFEKIFTSSNSDHMIGKKLLMKNGMIVILRIAHSLQNIKRKQMLLF